MPTDNHQIISGYYLSTGQNLAWGFPHWEGAVTGWFNEVQYFLYGTGSSTGRHRDVGHYTQVTYKRTLKTAKDILFFN